MIKDYGTSIIEAGINYETRERMLQRMRDACERRADADTALFFESLRVTTYLKRETAGRVEKIFPHEIRVGKTITSTDRTPYSISGFLSHYWAPDPRWRRRNGPNPNEKQLQFMDLTYWAPRPSTACVVDNRIDSDLLPPRDY